MIDAGDALHVAYTALLASLTYAGQAVPVYALMAEDNVPVPYYVILGPWQGRSDNTKDSFGQIGEITLDIVTRFEGNQRSNLPAETIAAAITTLLKPTVTAEPFTLSAPLRCYATRIVNTQTLSQQTPTVSIIRKLLTISHRIDQF